MNIDLLKRLCETPGVPGHEHRVTEMIDRRDLQAARDILVAYLTQG